jgi:hypothetical protein
MNRLQLANAKKAEMESKLSGIAGTQLEITIRGDKSFTLSFDGINKTASEKLINFFSGYTVSRDEDEELGTCIYLDA